MIYNKNLKLYRIVRYWGQPLALLVFAYSRKEAIKHSIKKHGPVTHAEIKCIRIKSGTVLTEIERR
ncbi:hypothetical protein LCGC14_2433520 [marine sediment metagenome]|uniref:Uncharacterized protein n=1 Tax=marine sediment metagenome TaxID=412755 RepID=A0A0F9BL79_9ZZZZ